MKRKADIRKTVGAAGEWRIWIECKSVTDIDPWPAPTTNATCATPGTCAKWTGGTTESRSYFVRTIGRR
jgi:hypothetical protein